MSGYEGADEVVGAVVDGIHVVFGIVPFVKDESDVGCGIGKQKILADRVSCVCAFTDMPVNDRNDIES